MLANGREHGGVMLRQRADSDGYLRVTLSDGSRSQTFGVHRLVLLAFVGPCPDGMEACHGPQGRGVNHLSELRWGTKLENEQDKWREEEKMKQEGGSPPLFPVTDVIDPVTLTEASELGIVCTSVSGLRMARHRHPAFPKHVGFRGAIYLYNPAELSTWELKRRGIA
jgi:hypothetical protein